MELFYRQKNTASLYSRCCWIILNEWEMDFDIIVVHVLPIFNSRLNGHVYLVRFSCVCVCVKRNDWLVITFRTIANNNKHSTWELVLF